MLLSFRVMDADKTILLVEDDAIAREAIALALTIAGYRVATAGDGREALDYLHRHGPVCLILLDLFMPGMDGAEFRRQQRQDPALKAVPVVLLSGTDQVQAETAALGAQGFVHKPVEPVSLLATVRGFACPRDPVVLLVAVEDDMTGLVTAALRQRGFDVYQTPSGAEAVELLRKNKHFFALTLVDLRGAVDGPRLVADIRQANPKVPCCLLNQRAGSHSPEELKQAGAAHVFPGMIEAAQLFRKLADPVTV